MILHDRITVTTKGAELGEDSLGNPIFGPDVTSDPIPAEISPVNSDEQQLATADVIITTYRLSVRGLVPLDTTSVITWRGTDYKVQGDIETYTVNGRVHHQEALIRRYSG